MKTVRPVTIGCGLRFSIISANDRPGDRELKLHQWLAYRYHLLSRSLSITHGVPIDIVMSSCGSYLPSRGLSSERAALHV